MNTVWLVVSYVIGVMPVDTHKSLWQPSPRTSSVRSASAARPTESASFRLHEYRYVFEGQTIHKGQPCAGTVVNLWVTNSREAQKHMTVSDSDGRYRMEIVLTGRPNESIEWEMSAWSPNRKKTDFAGRRILMQEEETSVVSMANNISVL